jgi:polyhydroxyalkanoate synthase
MIQIIHAYNLIYLRTFEENFSKPREGKRLNDFYNSWLKLMDGEVDKELKSDSFKSLLSDYTDSLVELHASFRKLGCPTEYFDWISDIARQNFMSLPFSIPRELKLSRFDVIYTNRKTRLLHYRSHNHDPGDDINKERNRDYRKQPLLMVYAPINRFHTMDLNLKRSVVRNLLSHRIDVYLLDLGYTTREDSHLSLYDYINHLNDAVQIIKDNSGLDRVSILGYCWGGILALIYTAQKNNNVKSLALMATPVDFKKDNTILANWSRAINIDKMMEEFGNMSGLVMDLLFIMRNPPRYAFDKYLKWFEKSNDAEFVDTFFDVERWLYDTPSVPGNLFRQIINDCYKNNLLIIPNKMEIDNTEQQRQQHLQRIDLRNVTVPLLMIDAEKDDLVTTDSALDVSKYVSSKDKKSMINPGGHVALCISDTAHKKLWPEVAEWILSKE